MADGVLRELKHRTQTDQGIFPNAPGAEDYVRHAEDLGLCAQLVCDSKGSHGAYYTVYALYEPELAEGTARFGAEPLALVFEDYSRSMWSCWLVPLPDATTEQRGR